ncbi:Protein of unknown function [Pyronema omphalodes CBS 100304]|uniref:Uncharacterized protein n=1 Tax=Pyronema omphalodes (strain CBS 100304) TaxID=1076935 RepID=U4KZX7_PYROM|nr:Protein of unknown function [Pyronema omphalodes CBS 100304]
MSKAIGSNRDHRPIVKLSKSQVRNHRQHLYRSVACELSYSSPVPCMNPPLDGRVGGGPVSTHHQGRFGNKNRKDDEGVSICRFWSKR